MPVRFDATQLKRVARRYKLDLIILFGSQAKGRASEGSDIDVAVRARRRRWGDADWELGLVSDLAAALESGGEIDVAFLNGADPVLLFEVASDGVPLFEAEPAGFAQFCSYAARRYEDNRKWFERRRRYQESKYV
ncbi:MAG TPA: nucleotidyltransferase domain-containing protein [Anaerolineae bacterium]|nr:nucleotidyltransferase domain-containing protein [Anaerolineae bacterium]